MYDESTACPMCGSGAKQTTDLFLNPRSLARKKTVAIAATIADEVVVSSEFVDMLARNQIQDAQFRPVRQRRSKARIEGWHQLAGTLKTVDIVSPTKTGLGLCEDDPTGRYRCPFGDQIGLNMISELFVARQSFDCDIALTRQFIGVRRGLLRPRQELVISSKVWRLINETALKGFTFEVAHLV